MWVGAGESGLKRAPNPDSSMEINSMSQRDTTDGSDSQEPDTPGRPKSGASRQQTQPNQGAQTGNSDIDSKEGRHPRNDHHVRNEK